MRRQPSLTAEGSALPNAGMNCRVKHLSFLNVHYYTGIDNDDLIDAMPEQCT